MRLMSVYGGSSSKKAERRPYTRRSDGMIDRVEKVLLEVRRCEPPSPLSLPHKLEDASKTLRGQRTFLAPATRDQNAGLRSQRCLARPTLQQAFILEYIMGNWCLPSHTSTSSGSTDASTEPLKNEAALDRSPGCTDVVQHQETSTFSWCSIKRPLRSAGAASRDLYVQQVQLQETSTYKRPLRTVGVSGRRDNENMYHDNRWIGSDNLIGYN
ncbi:hypothetical protein FHG87_000982 [Trinorchestia longiramus]|nr:hypothetical protein FHG87_000982 [Trinorchestia longiramus]